jgi:hypothetical protein
MTEFDVQVLDGFKEVSIIKFQKRNSCISIVNIFGFHDARLKEAVWYGLTEGDTKGCIEVYDSKMDEYVEYTWGVIS